jgi:hypothetical protein
MFEVTEYLQPRYFRTEFRKLDIIKYYEVILKISYWNGTFLERLVK